MILKTPEGNEFETYISGPEEAAGAVLLVHDWWGVLDYNRAWADRLGELGYRTMVVDLYDGERARSVEEAGEMMRSLDQDEVDSKLITALEHLKRGGARVATLGWSLGGRQAMQAALLDPEAVVAAVLFYCRMLTDVGQLSQLGGPVLAIYAENEQTWPAKMENFNRAMAEAGKDVESLSFPAGHGFVNPGSDRYAADYAEQAFDAVSAFLGRVMT